MARDPLRNEAIRSGSLRVIGEDGTQLGVLSREEALSAAREAELDLVEVSPDSKPPVARIIDWGKYKYQRTKQAQKSRKKARSPELKQMRIGLKISSHDLGVKLRKVTEFLDAGHKVRIAIIYRGREMAHRDLGYKLAERVQQELDEGIVAEQEPQFAGRQLSFVIRRKSGSPTKLSAKE